MVVDARPDLVRHAFDAVADIFDETFENERTRRVRSRIYNIIETILPPGSKILDINCGTGIDARALLERGYDVTGTDISPGMVSVAQRNVPQGKFYACSFEALRTLSIEHVDLVLSNFGGLNCTQILHPVADAVISLLRPGGYFLGVFMSRFSLWETVAGLLQGDLGTASRRLRGTAPATGFPGIGFTVFYHTHRSLLSPFGDKCTVRHVSGINILSPPPHAEAFVKRHPRLSGILEWIESRVATIPGLRTMGDHSIVLLQTHR